MPSGTMYVNATVLSAIWWLARETAPSRAMKAVANPKTLTSSTIWIAAGKPPGKQTLGMFEAWVETVGGIFDVIEVPGLLANAKQFELPK